MIRSTSRAMFDRLEPRLLWSGSTALWGAVPAPSVPAQTLFRGSQPTFAIRQAAAAAMPAVNASVSAGTIIGRVFSDADGDGLPNDGRTVPGAVAYVDLNGDGVLTPGVDLSATADASTALFRIENVPVGTWPVGVQAQPPHLEPAGFVLATVTAGQETDTKPLASYRARLIGYVYEDANANGQRDVGEVGLHNVRVFISSNPAAIEAGNGEPSTLTDSNGRYVLYDVADRHGVLRVVPQFSNYVVGPYAFHTDAIASSFVGIVAGPTVAITPPGQTRMVFTADLDGDGVATAADALPSGFSVQVYVDIDRDGVFDANEPGALGANSTEVVDIPAGRQLLRVIPPQGWTTSLPGNAVEFDVRSRSWAAFPGLVLYPPTSFGGASVSGRVAEDTDFSNSVSPTEPARPFTPVWHDLDADGLRDQREPYTYADLNGQYALFGLPAGTQRLAFAPGSGYVPLDAGPNAVNIAVATGSTAMLNLPLYAPTRQVRIGGQVRLDANNNGVFDDTDPPLPNAAVTNNFGAVGLTDAQGRFSAMSAAGTFAPVVSFLRGYTNLNTVSVRLTPGRTNDSFALLVRGPSATLGAISGVAYNDDNFNGVRDTGETPLAGKLVWADTDGNGIRSTTNEPAATTAADGSYSLSGLPPQTLNVYITLTSPMTLTTFTNNRRAVTLTGSNVGGVDFGVGNGVPVAGTVYNDYQRDGVRGPHDQGLSGLVVWADLNNDGVYDPGADASAVTANGAYTIAGIPPNVATTVRVMATGGYTPVGPGSVLVPGAAGGTARQVNFGFSNNNALIAGRVFYDANQNGIPDGVNEVQSGHAVSLRNATTDAVLATVSTDATGVFRFHNQTPGTYRLTYGGVSAGGEYVVQLGKDGLLVTVGANAVSDASLFSYYRRPMTYVGHVYNDVDQDGDAYTDHDAQDVPLAGVRAFFDANNNALFDTGEPTAVTDANGTYTLTDVPWGTYNGGGGYPNELFIENPLGLLSLTSQPLWPGYDTATGVVNVRDVIFTMPRGPFVSGYVYDDRNTNGRRDAGEPGLYRRGVQFAVAAHMPLQAMTDRFGHYVFERPEYIGSGNYQLKTDIPAGWFSTDGSGGRPTVSFDQGNPVADIGFVPYQIGGTLYQDANGNHVQDSGDAPIAGRVVWLDTDADGMLDTGETSVVSDANGFYSFGTVGAGTFRIAQALPSGWVGRTQDVTVAATQAIGNVSLGSRPAPPTAVAEITVGDGSAGRTWVRELTLTLSGVVTADRISAGAFTLVRAGSTTGGYAAIVSRINALSDERTAITLGFTGPDLVAGSLNDGRYRLQVDGSRITDALGQTVDAAGNGLRGSLREFEFIRLAADADGNAKVNFNDFLSLQAAFGSRLGGPRYQRAVDIIENGVIDFNDFLVLQAQFGKSV